MWFLLGRLDVTARAREVSETLSLRLWPVYGMAYIRPGSARLLRGTGGRDTELQVQFAVRLSASLAKQSRALYLWHSCVKYIHHVHRLELLNSQ